MSRPTVVAYDIDDVWHPWYSLAHQASLQAGLANPDMPSPSSWAPHEEYGCTLEEWVAVLESATEAGTLHESTPHHDDLKVFWDLAKRGVPQHFITARGFMGRFADLIREETKTWVEDKFHGHAASLSFAKDKGEVAKRLGVTHAIDDNVGNYESLAAVGVEVYLMDKPWNQHAVGARRVKSLTEFGEAVKNGGTTA